MREVALAQAADARADAQLHREAPPPLTRAEKKNLEADIREAAEEGPPPPPTDQYRRAEIEADQQAWNRLNAARIAEERRLGLRADAEARYGSLDDNLTARRGSGFAVGPGTAVHPVADERVAGARSAVMEKPPRAPGSTATSETSGSSGSAGRWMRTPQPTSAAIGNHAPYTKSAPKAGVGKGASPRAARRIRTGPSAARCRASTWRGNSSWTSSRGTKVFIVVLCVAIAGQLSAMPLARI